MSTRTIVRTQEQVPLLEVPELAGTACDSLTLHSAMLLSKTEMANALAAIKEDGKDAHGVVRYLGTKAKDGTLVGVAQRFSIHPLPDEDQRQRVMEALGSEEEAAGLVHVDVDVTAFPNSAISPPEDRGQEMVVSAFWDWVKGHPLDSNVRAWITFDSERFEPIIGLPLRVPADLGAFDSIPGLIFAKRQGEGAEAKTLYEVLVRQDEGALETRVNFRGLADGAADMLKKLLSQAIEVAQFAVRAKPEPGPTA